MLCVEHPSQLQKYQADDSIRIREDLYLLGVSDKLQFVENRSDAATN